MSQSDSLNDPRRMAMQFAELNDFVYAGGGGRAALERLVGLAVSSVPQCRYSAVSEWSPTQQPRTLAATDETAAVVNLVQHHLGDGPCLTAARRSEIVRIPDLTLDDRFPRFSTTVMSQTPVKGVLSFHVVNEPTPTALSLFSDVAGAFDDEAFNVAALFAAHARVLLTHAASSTRADSLEAALLTSRQIGAAIGILMNVYKITEDQAFERLRRSSNQTNRKLRDIAGDVLQTGALPTS